MPYKHRDPWSRAIREYMRDQVLAEVSDYYYRSWLAMAGRLLGNPSPRSVTLSEMRGLELRLGDSEATRAVRCAVVRRFLVHSGNMEALKWRIVSRQRPKVDGVFLSEQEIGMIRTVAKAMGVEHELLFSLGVDNGLRVVDIHRLTMSDARRFVDYGHSQILSKGRGGGKRRLMVMSETTFDPLVRYLDHRRELVDEYGTKSRTLLLTWSSRYGLQTPSDCWIRDRLNSLSRASGIYFTPHDLRRTFGNRHWRIGTPLETIAQMLGHESINMTFRAYIGVQLSDMREAQRKLCPSVASQFPASQ